MDPRPKFAYSQELLHGVCPAWSPIPVADERLDRLPSRKPYLTPEDRSRDLGGGRRFRQDPTLCEGRREPALPNQDPDPQSLTAVSRVESETEPLLNPYSPSQDPLEPIPIPQEVPNPVRDHMSAFSFAYSKLLVFVSGFA